METPRVRYEDGVPARIELHEPFLQYLWAIAFAMVVLDQEVHRRAQRGVPEHPNPAVRNRLVRAAEAAFGWAFDARETTPAWRQEWPRPGRPVPGDGIDYVAKANGLYVAAAVYVLLHEYAHVTLDHLWEAGDRSLEEAKAVEAEADVFAREALLDGDDGREARTRRAGVVVAHCALLFLAVESKNDRERHGGSRLSQSRHPDLDDRLLHALGFLDPEAVGPEDHLWTMAGCALTLFLSLSERPPEIVESETAQAWVGQLVREVDELKEGIGGDG
ncbi:phage exclusion protein Lit family protein [Rubrivirga marina]|uniref:phage exclusion protein Lit family protein n=1 Tax=Rubrivirga marina TaxID=1196024 RepID=UPI0015C78417|nr:phage exclusion protein Lit family protein [Rubrivirga marina]